MAIFRPGGAVGQISGAAGGFVFVQGRSGPVARVRGVRSGGGSVALARAQGAAGRIAAAWQALSTSERAAWRALAAVIPRPNRLGVERLRSGWQVFFEYCGEVYNGAPPAGVTPPAFLNLYMAQYVGAHFLAGGPFAVTSWGSPWTGITPLENGYLQRGRYPNQVTGWNRYRFVAQRTKLQSTEDWYSQAVSRGLEILAGERFAWSTSWRVSGGFFGQRVWAAATMDSTPWVVEDFESGSLSIYSGDTGNFSLVTSPIKGGTYSLKCALVAGPAVLKGISTRYGLPVFPVRGHVFEYWARFDSASVRHRTWFGYQDDTNGYVVHLNPGGAANIIQVVAGVSTNKVTLGFAALGVDKWYRLVVSWGYTGNLALSLYNDAGGLLATGTGADTTYQAGGIRIQYQNVAGQATLGYWDDYRITGRAA